MTFIHVVILGIVEGITEFLPISSTAHLEFVSSFLKLQETEALKSFLIIIQLGAICAVIVLFARRFITSWNTYRQVIYAFIPTALIGFVGYKLIKTYIIGNTFIAACTLILGGIVLVVVERWYVPKNKGTIRCQTMDELNNKELVGIGLAQAVAVIPGISRSGAIITYGLFRSIPRAVIIDFAFLLAIPTMFAASGYDLLKSRTVLTQYDLMLIGVGFVISFVVALFVIKWFLKYIQNNSFELFGWYRIVVGFAVLIYNFLK